MSKHASIEFVAISSPGDSSILAGAICNDFEAQLDCDYPEMYKNQELGKPTSFRVVVTITELGPM